MLGSVGAENQNYSALHWLGNCDDGNFDRSNAPQSFAPRYGAIVAWLRSVCGADASCIVLVQRGGPRIVFRASDPLEARRFRRRVDARRSDSVRVETKEDSTSEEEDEEDDEVLRVPVLRPVLHVIEIHSGNILQTAPLELSGRSISSIIVDGDEIYIASFCEREVVVLPFAGSEA